MKHTYKITLILVITFLLAQIIGLFIISNYVKSIDTTTGQVEYSNLPGDIERPQVDETSSFIYIITAVLIGTLIVLILIKLKFGKFWMVWFFISILVCLIFAINPFMEKLFRLFTLNTNFPLIASAAVALVLAFYKIIKKNIWIHNGTELIIYGGLAAIFIPIMNLFSVFALLILISIYDAIAVWQSKHMITLAKFQTEQKLFAGLSFPYSKSKVAAPTPTQEKTSDIKATATRPVVSEERNAILGGGDIAFPLIFSGVVLKWLIQNNPTQPVMMFFLTLIISFTTAGALFYLLYKAEEDKFYPAMPFITAGCFIGFGIIYGLSFVL